ncbi:MAG: metalloregulator ArsR/SmtB family transcription factor [Chthoniobacterales bacterium]
MDIRAYHQLLSEEIRLRIVNLLLEGPLCVCHFQELLDQSQVKISKHLAILRQKGLVEAHREANWMIYDLLKKRDRWLKKNLKALKQSRSDEKFLKEDLERREKLMVSLSRNPGLTPGAVCAPTE